MHFRIVLGLCVLWLTLASGQLCADEWGSLRGQVVLSGELPTVHPLVSKGAANVKDAVCNAQDVPDDSLLIDIESRGIANVFVFLRRQPKVIHPDLQRSVDAEIVFDQKACRFTPHAMIVRTDQTVLVKSDDNTNHNTHTHPTFNTPENFLVQPNSRDGLPLTFRLPEPNPVKVTCDLHPWMQAYWLVIGHPYAAVTNERGEFTIDKLPVGTHTFRVWHERAGWIEKSLMVEIASDPTTLAHLLLEVSVDKVTNH